MGMSSDHLEEPPVRHWADIRFDMDYVAVVAHSGYRSTAMDPDRYFAILPGDVDCTVLAGAVRDALRASRFLPLQDAQDFLVKARSPVSYSTWIADMLRRTGRRSKQSLFRTQRHLLVIECSDQLLLQPSTHVRADLFHGIVEKIRRLPVSMDDRSLGEALRHAMTDCQ